jgi:hypothetical protein
MSFDLAALGRWAVAALGGSFVLAVLLAVCVVAIPAWREQQRRKRAEKRRALGEEIRMMAELREAGRRRDVA